MVRLPGGPARFFKTRYIVAVLVAAALVAASLTGFAWADKQVTVVVDGDTRVLHTQVSDVSSLIEEAGIEVSDADLVSPAPSAELRDGDAVVVRHAVPVSLILGDETISLSVLGKTVADALVVAGLDPTSGMHTDPAMDEPLTDGMTIRVTDVFVRIQQAEEDLPFDVVLSGDPKLPHGTRKVARKGVAGRSLRVYEVLMVGGEPGRRTLSAQKTLSAPVDEIVYIGTKEPLHQIVRAALRHSAPTPPKVGKAFYVTSTAYTPWDAGCGGIGEIQYRKRRYDIPDGWGIIAVDPKVIPMGSRVYVAGYGYAVACDTGGAINGKKIDVCFWGADLYAPTSNSADHDNAVKRAARNASRNWGVRTHVKIVILSNR